MISNKRVKLSRTFRCFKTAFSDSYYTGRSLPTSSSVAFNNFFKSLKTTKSKKSSKYHRLKYSDPASTATQLRTFFIQNYKKEWLNMEELLAHLPSSGASVLLVNTYKIT